MVIFEEAPGVIAVVALETTSEPPAPPTPE
jgi:hypothetical protein